MRYLEGKAQKTFLFSATQAGSGTHEQQDREHTVEYTFNMCEWEEHHPYGDTTAAETLSEVDDDSHAYKLDGETIELDELRKRFGTDWVDELITNLDNDAETAEKQHEY